MRRSFSERIFGGVCGGMAAALRWPVWPLRLLFVALAVVSGGLVALWYVLLWWLLPPESPAQNRFSRAGLSAPLALLLALGLSALAWFARDLAFVRTAGGQDLLWPGALLLLGTVFLLRQLRA
ncbi:MAG: PspC domain-containing protein [Chloroflexi bacterium]|nr:PspC domain-containing protein [Chloroflexota bacterium]